MTDEQKALATLHAIARLVAEDEGRSLTIAHDWGLGSATIIDETGAHTHVGLDTDDEVQSLRSFVDGLYSLLVLKRGLSWARPQENHKETSK